MAIKRRLLSLFFLVSIFTTWGMRYCGVSHAQDASASLIEAGKICHAKGDIEQAARLWEQALTSMNLDDAEGRIDVSTHLLSAFQALGYHDRAVGVLRDAMPWVEKNEDRHRNAIFYSVAGDLFLSLGQPEKAATFFEKGIEQARQAETPEAKIAIFNQVGNGLAAEGRYDAAMAFYRECLGLIRSSPDYAVYKPRVLLNLARLGIEMGAYEEIADSAGELSAQLTNTPDSFQKAFDLITLSRIFLEVGQKSTENGKATDTPLLASAYDVLTQARQIGEKMENPRILSCAWGYLGQLYEMRGRFTEAADLTRKAVFWATQGDDPEIAYLWKWQMGRLRRAMGETDPAIAAFREAVAVLNPIRRDMFKGYRTRKDRFKETVRPVYIGLTSLLLEQAASLAPGSEKEDKLIEARDVMELLKTAELENFFSDECVAVRQSTTLDRPPAGTAILYPISLPDRIALLLALPDKMLSLEVKIDAEQFEKTVVEYRGKLQTRTDYGFLADSQKIYDWIVRPVRGFLQAAQTDTLIILPDGLLRLIPFPTLHDGERFLIETYAIGTIPAIRLTDPSPVRMPNFDILMSGLSESRFDFPALPGVTAELTEIVKLADHGKLLENKDYTVDNLARELTEHAYPIVHIATHAIFGGSPDESYLLAYDGRLSMDRLEALAAHSRFRKQKTELLTLSACQTALGNERAAMGLAGVAVKAGVKSVIATLWFVDDEATSHAIIEFYRELKKGNVSKAKAMQHVQKNMIATKRFHHPLYWAPFLVIGNWM